MPGPNGPDNDTLVRAWRLRVLDALPLHEVAEKLGCSLSSAKRWIAQGRDLVAELAYLDEQRTVLDRRNIREDQVAVMDEVRNWMIEARNQGLDVFKCAEIVIRAEERKAKALGEQAMARLELAPAPELPRPSVETMRAIEAYHAGAR
jgi:hypothetical protein